MVVVCLVLQLTNEITAAFPKSGQGMNSLPEVVGRWSDWGVGR